MRKLHTILLNEVELDSAILKYNIILFCIIEFLYLIFKQPALQKLSVNFFLFHYKLYIYDLQSVIFDSFSSLKQSNHDDKSTKSNIFFKNY